MKLQDYRKQENKTQEQVAEELGVAQSNIASWENGIRIPTKDNMQRIVAYTKGEVQPNDFYEVSDE
jgi:transcriptional regulator with XRE-family HTH domain